MQDNKMKKMLFSAALAMLITGCAQQTFTVGNKPTAVTPKETITHHFFVSPIGQRKLLMQPKFVGGAENVVKTETQQTFVNALPGFITFGIYTPLEARVYCSQ
nr:iss gene [Escherichia coli]